MRGRKSRKERGGRLQKGRLGLLVGAPPPPSSPPFIALVGAPRWALVGPTLGAPFQVGCSKLPPKVQPYGPLKAH